MGTPWGGVRLLRFFTVAIIAARPSYPNRLPPAPIPFPPQPLDAKPLVGRPFDVGRMSLSPQQLKKSLVEAGFEVFRTRGDEVVLAERPRENLIMDSGVRLRASSPLQVRLVLRAQKADFPNEDEVHLFERVRKLAEKAVTDGFVEVQSTVSPVTDPG